MFISLTRVMREDLMVLISSRHFARVGSGERGEQVEVEQRQENNHPLDYRFQKDTNEVNIISIT